MAQKTGYPLLERIAQREYGGEPLDTLIKRIVETHGTLLGAAKELDVARNTIRNWLHDNGYKLQMERRIKVVRK